MRTTGRTWGNVQRRMGLLNVTADELERVLAHVKGYGETRLHRTYTRDDEEIAPTIPILDGWADFAYSDALGNAPAKPRSSQSADESNKEVDHHARVHRWKNGSRADLVLRPEGCQMLGIGTQGLYDLLGAGLIKGVKRGTRTLLLVESLKTYATRLPPATVAPPKVRKPRRLREVEFITTA